MRAQNPTSVRGAMRMHEGVFLSNACEEKYKILCSIFLEKFFQ